MLFLNLSRFHTDGKEWHHALKRPSIGFRNISNTNPHQAELSGAYLISWNVLKLLLKAHIKNKTAVCFEVKTHLGPQRWPLLSHMFFPQKNTVYDGSCRGHSLSPFVFFENIATFQGYKKLPPKNRGYGDTNSFKRPYFFRDGIRWKDHVSVKFLKKESEAKKKTHLESHSMPFQGFQARWESKVIYQWYLNCYYCLSLSWYDTVDGWNPAPVYR